MAMANSYQISSAYKKFPESAASSPLLFHSVSCRYYGRKQRSPAISSIALSGPQQFRSIFSPFFTDAGIIKLRGDLLRSKRTNSSGGSCLASNAISLSTETLRWVFTGTAGLLMLLKNAKINKSFLVPLLALQAPHDAITWIRGEYGYWAVFLALLVRLFYYIPGELELPLILLLIVITAPYQVMDFRGTTGSIVACAVVATYLAYQHFSSQAGIKGSFGEGSFLASLAMVVLVAVPYIFLLGGF